MTIVYTAPLRGNEIPADRMASAGHAAIQVGHASEFLDHPGAGLYIDGGFDGFFAPLNGPLLFHCPAFTFSQLPGAPAISARFCAWPGFAERPLWEVAPQPGTEGIFMNIIVQLGLKPKIVPDIAGLIAPRILCTIINEAAFTLNDRIASAADIDTAMILGTNYPKGPVEWAKKIGTGEIEKVLKEMSKEDPRYSPHPLLEQLIDLTDP